MSQRDEIAEGLEVIKEQIEELLFDARELVDEAGGGAAARAHAYWIPHMDSALNNESWFSLQSTINELRKEDDEEE